MIERGKISAGQMAIMLYLAITPTAILTVPSISFQYARQDFWISPLWAGTAIATVFVALRLHRMYPGLNLLQVSERVLGRLSGKLIGFIILFMYLYLDALVIREYGDFVVGAFLRQTPLIVVSGCMVLVSALAVRGGVEIVARFGQLFLPAFLVFFLFIILPIIPDLNVTFMLPVMAEGIMPSISGSGILQVWYSEFITISFLLPFVADRRKAAKSCTFAILAVILTLVISNLTTLLLLGELTDKYNYPFLVVARYISVADFFAHLESLFMAIWVLGVFVKICVFYYVTVLGTAQWLNLPDYRTIVFPIGFMITFFSMWMAPGYQELIFAIETTVTYYQLTAFVVIPVILFCIASIRKQVSGVR
ncbi:MAG: endospore germination permease [Brevibacillus sp.]|nr:endospore germination permease [Brevibacillus sp.]